MPRMCTMNKPAIKHNDYATISVSISSGVNEVAEWPVNAPASGYFLQNYARNSSAGQQHTDAFTISINNRCNGKEIFYVITGEGAEASRFYNASLSSQYYQDANGQSVSAHPLYGTCSSRVGTQTLYRKACASTTNSNPGATFSSTSFTIEVRLGSQTGPLLATSPTITVHRFAFFIEVWNDVSSVYQTSYTYPAESAIGFPANNRNIYCRLSGHPSDSVYHVYNLMSSTGYVLLETGGAGTATTPGTDYWSGTLTLMGFYDAPTTYTRPTYTNAIYKDGATEGAETFRFAYYWPGFGGTTGTKWAYSADCTIAANTT